MRTANMIIELILMIILTFALFFHFFPQPYLPDWSSLILWLILPLILVSAILSKKVKVTERESKHLSFYSGIYLLFLIILFSLTGGKLSSGTLLSNPIFWIIFAIGLFIDWRKIRKQK